MSIIQGTVKGGSVADTGFSIDQSLRFNDDDSAYLSWTPESAGNRKTWTFSTWIKRNNINTDQWIFSSNNGVLSPLSFTASNNISLSINSSDDFITSAVYRDTSSWYHIVLAVDTTQSTASDRSKLYVNGEQVTDFSYTNYASQNEDTSTNDSCLHTIGRRDNGSNYVDMYLSETHFIDGQALTPDNFGEFDSTYGHWKPIAYDGSYGTNGFYLPYKQDYSVEGFSTTLYTGDGDSNTVVSGVGFSPDLVWVKNRTATQNHRLWDTVRGVNKALRSNYNDAEYTGTSLTSFNTDGFTIGNSDADWNGSGAKYVAWSWDMGDSTVENTDGSITSQVRANPTYGQSIVSYTVPSSGYYDFGHGLSQKPDLIIYRRYNTTGSWMTFLPNMFSNTEYLILNDTLAKQTDLPSTWLGTTGITDSLMGGLVGTTFNAGDTVIAYNFHSVAGYSKIGSYTGTGSSGHSIELGFKPAWVMIKRTDSTGQWSIWDIGRQPDGKTQIIYPNLSNAEESYNSARTVTPTDTGFILNDTNPDENASGGSYIYMAFADTREYGFWLDDSGNNNDFTINNLTESDVSLDSPTNNFCTWNPLFTHGNASTFSEGNLRVATATSDSLETANFSMTSGKWYAEVVVENTGGEAVGIIGRSDYSLAQNDIKWIGYYPTSYAYYSVNGNLYNNNAGVAYGSTYTTGDIIGIAVDLDANTVTFYKNNVSQGSQAITAQDAYFIAVGDGSGLDSDTLVANFGQDSSFAGNKTSQGYTDANGYGDFYYEPPAGYLALCTANMEEPSVVPSEHFEALADSGNNKTVTLNTLESVDFLWSKSRSLAADHYLFDTIRGDYEMLRSNGTSAEEYLNTSISSIGDNSFDVGSYGNMAGSNIYWAWKAGGTGVSNTDGSITSTVSANVDAGFSIVSYTGNGVQSSVGHGLNAVPELIIVKDRTGGGSGDQSWIVSLPDNSKFLQLNSTNAQSSVALDHYFGTRNSSIFTVGGTVSVSGHTNESGHEFIAYCFHSVEGYSKIGTYTGNGSTDGTFVYCGFRPKYVMTKRTDSTSGWYAIDTERDIDNVNNQHLRPDTYNAEFTGGDLDVLSNGFKARTTSAEYNASGGTYLFIAFAEMPTKYTNAR